MSNNIRQAIKHIELMSEQIEALEQQNIKLKEQLNTAICLLCSNKASVVYEQHIGKVYYSLHVEALDGNNSGTFSPEESPYKAVLTGVDEYLEYMKEHST